MQTSAKGRADIKLHEGEVLKAYRCPAGKLTIGVGLTSASGVVKVTPGMRITAEESDRLLTLALNRNYEPRVANALTHQLGSKVVTPNQHEFDGAVSFDFNTGAIHKASWVKAWRMQDWVAVEAKLKLWTKGGGKVLPGLVRRREAEYQMIRFGRYASDKAQAYDMVPSDTTPHARLALQLTRAELVDIREAFRKLGYDVGPDTTAISAKAVRVFQAKHDLTVDGIIGRSTLSTLQRALDARAKGKPAAVATGATGGATTLPNDTVGDLTGLPELSWLPAAALGLTLAYALWLAWRYRDQVAAAVQPILPRVAAFLRSF